MSCCITDLILDLYKYWGGEILMFNCCYDRLITMEKCYPCPPLSFFTSKKTQVFFVRYDIVKKYDMEKCSLIIKKKNLQED